LKQILVNLLSNAVKFTPEGGSIGLEVKGDLEKDVVRFTVWDTGIGIPKVDIERLFEPFVQLDSSLSRQFVGTGLGLSLVYRMTELHGGGISLHSEENKGSRFTVSFPWGKETAADESNDQPLDDEKIDPVTVTWYAPGTDRLQTVTDQIHSSSQLILIVEDNEANIDTLSEYLPYKGFQIVVARNGNEAIDRARETKPDLILMDIQTPGMDGITATRYIRQDSTLAGIPIIALTALAMPGDRERCLEAGVDEYLSKPVSLKQLLITIKEYLNLKVKTETK
jgi:CheY-like chemotaxis protein